MKGSDGLSCAYDPSGLGTVHTWTIVIWLGAGFPPRALQSSTPSASACPSPGTARHTTWLCHSTAVPPSVVGMAESAAMRRLCATPIGTSLSSTGRYIMNVGRDRLTAGLLKKARTDTQCCP